MDFVGVIVLVVAVFVFGGVTGHMGASSDADKRCERGEPVVIKEKVYRCVEQKQ